MIAAVANSKRANERASTPSHPCGVVGCWKPTNGGKEFCHRHVLLHDYARSVERQVEVALEEVERVRLKGSRAVDINGMIAQEILRLLMIEGPKTIERLGRDISYITGGTAEEYTNALHRAKLVRFSKTKRGSRVIRLREEE